MYDDYDHTCGFSSPCLLAAKVRQATEATYVAHVREVVIVVVVIVDLYRLICVVTSSITTCTGCNTDKRAQRALGRSPEDKVKGHSGANNRKPQGHNLNNFGKGPLDDIIYRRCRVKSS